MNQCQKDTKMYLVVDVNVVISSLLSQGDSFEVFALNKIFNKFDFVAPEFLLIEFEKHKKEIIRRSKLEKGKAQEVIDFIIGEITFVPDSQFRDKLEEAREILKDHEKDVPYLALALKLNCEIFSGDKVFKAICKDRVKNPKEILEVFYGR
ncbi:PIN domain-containing protein [Nanoarchaeota archaeon]